MYLNMDGIRQIISVAACRLAQFECTNVPETLITSIYLNEEGTIFFQIAGNRLQVYALI